MGRSASLSSLSKQLTTSQCYKDDGTAMFETASWIESTGNMCDLPQCPDSTQKVHIKNKTKSNYYLFVTVDSDSGHATFDDPQRDCELIEGRHTNQDEKTFEFDVSWNGSGRRGQTDCLPVGITYVRTKTDCDKEYRPFSVNIRLEPEVDYR